MGRDRARTRDELLANLAEQRDFIRQAAKHYDAGKTYYAKQLATAASVLLQDGKNRSKSILTQLGIKDSLKFTNTIGGMEHPPMHGAGRNQY